MSPGFFVVGFVRIVYEMKPLIDLVYIKGFRIHVQILHIDKYMIFI